MALLGGLVLEQYWYLFVVIALIPFIIGIVFGIVLPAFQERRSKPVKKPQVKKKAKK
ncbi:hypothetical protein HS7_01100 [Sulfolobales archaeon HS-7]|nr:hypothetical protein HS7_01100 [Sulfolobales archaeon HS-7]